MEKHHTFRNQAGYLHPGSSQIKLSTHLKHNSHIANVRIKMNKYKKYADSDSNRAKITKTS